MADQKSTVTLEEILQTLSSGQVDHGKAIALLGSAIVNIKERLEEFIAVSTKAVSALTEDQTKSGSSNWKFLAGGAGVIIAAFIGLYTVVSLGTQVTLAPIATKAEISERDRSDIHRDVDALKISVANLATSSAVQTAHEAEVEAQLNCMDVVRDLQLASQQQMNAILSQKAELTIPPLNYSPQCRVSH